MRRLGQSVRLCSFEQRREFCKSKKKKEDHFCSLLELGWIWTKTWLTACAWVGKDSTIFTIELQMLHMDKLLRNNPQNVFCAFALNTVCLKTIHNGLTEVQPHEKPSNRLFSHSHFTPPKVSSVSLLQELTT